MKHHRGKIVHLEYNFAESPWRTLEKEGWGSKQTRAAKKNIRFCGLCIVKGNHSGKKVVLRGEDGKKGSMGGKKICKVSR